jgi:hypothetical protein
MTLASSCAPKAGSAPSPTPQAGSDFALSAANAALGATDLALGASGSPLDDKGSFAPRKILRSFGSTDSLSQAGLRELLGRMGIEDLRFPSQAGQPFLNVDWDQKAAPGEIRGSKLSVGFANAVAPDSLFAALSLERSSYDFGVASEFETFGARQDYEDLKGGKSAGLVEVGGIRGFERLHEGRALGARHPYLAIVFPFRDGYVAVTCDLGLLPAGDEGEREFAALESGAFPAGKARLVEIARAIARGIAWASGTKQ